MQRCLQSTWNQNPLDSKQTICTIFQKIHWSESPILSDILHYYISGLTNCKRVDQLTTDLSRIKKIIQSFKTKLNTFGNTQSDWKSINKPTSYLLPFAESNLCAHVSKKKTNSISYFVFVFDNIYCLCFQYFHFHQYDYLCPRTVMSVASECEALSLRLSVSLAKQRVLFHALYNKWPMNH